MVRREEKEGTGGKKRERKVKKKIERKKSEW